MSETSRLVPTSLEIKFSCVGKLELDTQKADIHTAEYLSKSLVATHPFWVEFHSRTQADNDPVIEWLKRTKSKRGGVDEDQGLVLDFLVEIYRKLDTLEGLIANRQVHYEKLDYNGVIDRIGHGCFSVQVLENQPLEEEMLYYGRVDLPTFPKRLVPLFFTKREDLCYVLKIHAHDESEWDGYVASKERDLIRELKRKKEQ